MAKLLFQGHGSIRITSCQNVVLYIDPFAGSGYNKEADIILITHQHYDHTNLDLIKRKKKCKIFQNFDMLKSGIYSCMRYAGFTITAVPAYNRNHPRNSCVGYVIAVDGTRIYASGDTSYIPEMEQLRELCLDYCLLPIDGVYNMDPEEATQCAEVIGARFAIPIHMVPGAKELYSEELAARFKPSNRCILKPGEEILL